MVVNVVYNQTIFYESEKSSYDPATGNHGPKKYDVPYLHVDIRWRSTGGLDGSGTEFEYREFISVKSQRPIPFKMMKWGDTIFKPIKGSYKKVERGRGRKWHSCQFMEVKHGSTELGT
ncbi:hypothetical protein [Candidatus Enterococcus clewellii]|uniref:hypothetical protein n=1 Tax=Candidatus Enterococcus clewellii TaxID=1834193 RepID=UPI0014838814